MKRTALALALVLALSLPKIAEAVEGPSAAENSWAINSSMHFSRTGAGAAAVDGIVYVIGGSKEYNTSDNGFSYISINSTEAYDPATDTWCWAMKTWKRSGILQIVPMAGFDQSH